MQNSQYEHIHTDDITWTEQTIFRDICVRIYAQMHPITINDKRDHEFGGEWEGYGREEKQGEML